VIFQTIGLQYTTASTASFITGLSVILVTLLSCLVDKRWPSITVLISVVLATAGIALITLHNGFTFNVGDWWVFLCACCFAVYVVLASKFVQSGNTLTLTFAQLVTITVVTGGIALFMGVITVPHTRNVWIAILFCAIFASVIAFSLQLHFQRYVSANKTAIIFATEPVFATLTAAVYLHERITWLFAIGALMVFTAIVLSEKSMEKKAEEE
jgi:drug/metabolite transporter (DMT)-like permease